jgi:hypothetical protein
MQRAEPAGHADQVPRLRAFKAAHPEITIDPPGPGRLRWIAMRDGAVLAAHFSLMQFLDQLDKLADG